MSGSNVTSILTSFRDELKYWTEPSKNTGSQTRTVAHVVVYLAETGSTVNTDPSKRCSPQTVTQTSWLINFRHSRGFISLHFIIISTRTTSHFIHKPVKFLFVKTRQHLWTPNVRRKYADEHRFTGNAVCVFSACACADVSRLSGCCWRLNCLMICHDTGDTEAVSPVKHLQKLYGIWKLNFSAFIHNNVFVKCKCVVCVSASC